LRGPVQRRHASVVQQGSPDANGEFLISGFTAAEVDWIRARALEAIETYRAAGGRLPVLSRAAIIEMLAYMTGKKIDDRFVDFMSEELMLDGRDARTVTLEGQKLAANFPVLVIGAGLGGILAGIRLKQAGIPFRIIEKNKGVGGTWFENSYPGCRVDVAGHSYSYSFEPNYEWNHYFPKAPEIRSYFDRCAVKFGLMDSISFETGVVEARFDENRKDWCVQLVGVDGKTETVRASAIISAVGQLNMPRMPDIEGLDGFNGPVVHSARWPQGLSLEGKRVALLGTGASALQIVPELAKTTEKLLVFARSAAWMFPNPIYHDTVAAGHRWALQKLPFYQNWYRFTLFYTYTEGVYSETLVDPDWNSPVSVSEANDELRIFMTEWIKSQVHDPDLLEKVVPNYPPFGKRILQDNGSYLAALQRENVSLEVSPIARILPHGIETTDGRTHNVDAIVCSTGFQAEKFLYPINIVGRGGIRLSDQWEQDNARAYFGITIPNFPNLFCIYGPNTNLAQAGSIVFNAESQVRYILQAIKMLLEGEWSAMECRPEVHDTYNAEVDRANDGTAWGAPGVKNWFKNSRGRVTANLPFRTIDYWGRTYHPDPKDFVFLSVAPSITEEETDTLHAT
jgi:4-hydroxyacetophenone monooxygenase